MVTHDLSSFDIEDRKGLEIVMLTALLSFQDSNEAHHAPPDSTTPSTPSIAAPLFGLVRKSSSQAALPPTPTPVMLVPPPLLNGVDHIAELQAQQGDYNEVTVSEEGIVVDYAQYCLNLLQDSAMLFITVRSSAPEHVPKVLQVVEETKRLRHKAGARLPLIYLLSPVDNTQVSPTITSCTNMCSTIPTPMLQIHGEGHGA
jgi:hypothetical protein